MGWWIWRRQWTHVAGRGRAGVVGPETLSSSTRPNLSLQSLLFVFPVYHGSSSFQFFFSAYGPDTLVVGLARLGTEQQVIACCTLAEMARFDLGTPLHSLVIPGELHPMEKELMQEYAVAVEEGAPLQPGPPAEEADDVAVAAEEEEDDRNNR